jgi:hypothetical protein
MGYFGRPPLSHFLHRQSRHVLYRAPSSRVLNRVIGIVLRQLEHLASGIDSRHGPICPHLAQWMIS